MNQEPELKSLRSLIFVLLALFIGVIFLDEWSGQSPVAKPEAPKLQETASIAMLKNWDENIDEQPIKEPLCENYQDIQNFDKPIPVIWTAEMTGCFESCRGGHFNHLPNDAGYKYPRFAAYSPDKSGRYPWDRNYNWEEGLIDEKFREDGVVLKIYGKWTNIDADHPNMVFGGKCVPIIEIEKIELAE